MNKPLKINLFDKCSLVKTAKIRPETACMVEHKASCGSTLNKRPKRVEIVQDGSGTVDVYTSDTFGIRNTGWAPRKSNTTNLRIGWMQECTEINDLTFASVRDKPEEYLGSHAFDYIFTHDDRLVGKDPRLKFILGNGFWVDDIKIHEKTKLLSMICSNKGSATGHQVRLNLLRRLLTQQTLRDHNMQPNVDFFGRGHDKLNVAAERVGLSPILDIEKKEQGLCDYMFSIAIENANMDTWITEKVMDCFATGTVPIYWGTRKIVDHFNKDGIIFLEDDFQPAQLSPELYYSKMDAIKENFEIAKQYEIPLDYMFNDLDGVKEYLPNLKGDM